MHSGRRKLLLADDSPTIQKVVNLTFEDEEMEVVAVSNGDDALRILEGQTPPDILLADVVMPGPNGYELCEHVKTDARLRHIPVILLVGAFEPFNEAEARRVGADTVLTKPFQSIRDLVSKVGSLLGGGDTKHEEETSYAQPSRREESAADESLTLHADVPMQRVEENAPADANAFGDSSSPFGHAAESSFDDFGADDELIEAKPADSFGVAASEAEEPHENAPAFVTEEPAQESSSAHEASFIDSGQEPFAAPSHDQEVAMHNSYPRSEPAFESHAHEPVESALAAPRSFAARAASAASADDALLDLGQYDAPSTSSTDDDDDFVLDIDLDEPTPSTPRSFAPAHMDAPSAFAEASHSGGGSAAAFKESTAPFQNFEHPATANVEAHAAPASEAVMQDEPQFFDAHDANVAPRGFVEPSVVPADAPVPTMAEPEFTDGSVEGDVAKPPVSPYKTQPIGDLPSHGDHAVGEARAGVEESLRADQLSPEAIDKIARRVVEMMSDKVVREIAWEVVPDLAELLIKRKLDEDKK